MRNPLMRGATLLGAAGFACLVVMIGWFGVRATLDRVTGGVSAIPAAIVIHLSQLLCCGLGWGLLLPRRVPGWRMFRARWVREAVNSILPVASIGGAVVGARLLTREGIDPPAATASAAADLTCEATSQVLFVICGLALAASLPHAPLSALWVTLVVLPLVLIVVSMIAAQALGLFGWLERRAIRLLPRSLSRPFRGLQGRLEALYAHKARVAGDFALNFGGWSIGAAEVWVLLHALDEPVTWQVAYVIESLGLIARSLAFAVPAGIAAQETGFVLACALFGIPHETGLALSLLKRLRELAVGVTGVLCWQWLERRVWLLRKG